jgi:membrane-bound lytic murein transglycosylase D
LEQLLEREGVPRELLGVVLVESGGDPFAISARGARGLWQFIPETARQYGLKVNENNDERIQVEAATRAAAHYLHDLFIHFGNWPLALAAYNCGQKTVDAALSKGRTRSFWELRSTHLLPAETTNYVPAVIASMQLLRPAAVASSSAPPISPAGLWIFAPARAFD